eukprot:6190220-Pleurochrysis_carterae.AAC.2
MKAFSSGANFGYRRKDRRNVDDAVAGTGGGMRIDNQDSATVRVALRVIVLAGRLRGRNSRGRQLTFAHAIMTHMHAEGSYLLSSRWV